jgi:hypothetical protein
MASTEEIELILEARDCRGLTTDPFYFGNRVLLKRASTVSQFSGSLPVSGSFCLLPTLLSTASSSGLRIASILSVSVLARVLRGVHQFRPRPINSGADRYKHGLNVRCRKPSEDVCGGRGSCMRGTGRYVR